MWPDRLDFREVSKRLRHHDAVGEHRSLGAAGGAAGIEQPGKIARPARYRIDAVALTQLTPIGAAGGDGAAAPRHVIGAIRTRQNQRGLSVADDVTELLAMEFGVHRHGDEPGMP